MLLTFKPGWDELVVFVFLTFLKFVKNKILIESSIVLIFLL